MKNILACIFLFSALPMAQPSEWRNPRPIPVESSENLFIVTIDGFRWQELFTGADDDILNNAEYTADPATIKAMYWDNNTEERRKKLMPFFWNVIAKNGQLYGNRKHGNFVNTANLYSCSYPGYNEIFTGHTNLQIATNKMKCNSNINVLEYLDSKEDFKGKVVAFTSWNVFPYILNEERNELLVNSGYENMEGTITEGHKMINRVQQEAVNYKGGTRYDELTFVTAKEYVQQNKPRVVYIGFGETDEHAHHGEYDLYLEKANAIDRMIAQLWHWIQSTPEYKDKTTLLITTDHGRGSRDSKWTSHSAFIKGSSQTWLAMLGPGVEAKGEMKDDQQLYQQQLAETMAKLVGEKFNRKSKMQPTCNKEEPAAVAAR